MKQNEEKKKRSIPYADNKKLKVINLFGGSGIGKSTTAAGLYYLMKSTQFRVELVHEIAKDCVWERRDTMFSEQDWLFAQQHRLIRRLVSHEIDYAITDSPLLLGIFYMPLDFPRSMVSLIEDTYATYTNINILLIRNPELPYVQAGRNEDQQTASLIDHKIQQYFHTNQIPYHTVMAGMNAAQQCYDIIIQPK